MQNKPIPAAAEGVPPKISSLLLEGIDQLGATRAAVELVYSALDSMGSDREIDALQYGVGQIRRELLTAMETIEAARRLDAG